MRRQYDTLVQQAHLVASELIRTAALWSEQWQEALTEASALYFGSGDVDGMIATLTVMVMRHEPGRGRAPYRVICADINDEDTGARRSLPACRSQISSGIGARSLPDRSLSSV